MDKLKYQEIYDIYKSLELTYGVGSCGGVSKALADKGIINKATGKPYSRQAIRLILSKTIEGRQLLEGHQGRQIAPPIIVEKRDGIRAWLSSVGVGLKFISNPTKDDVIGRYVYGNLPFDLAVYARSIWLPVIRGQPVMEDMSVEELIKNEVKLGEFKIKPIW